jgi:hypothetical protein
MPLTGRWAIYWGEDGSRWVYLERWDAVSIPAPVMRGFWNASEEAAHLLAIQGSGSPPPPIYQPRGPRRGRHAASAVSLASKILMPQRSRAPQCPRTGAFAPLWQ